METTLDRIGVGKTAMIVALDAVRDRQDVLHARGLAPGTEIAVLRGGDPMMIRVGESRWAISHADAKRIEIIVD